MIASPVIRVFSALVLASVSCSLGCNNGHGAYTSAHLEQAQSKLGAMKAAVEWQTAQTQFLAGDLKKAERTCDRAIELNPKVAKSHVLRARIFIEKGDLETARQSLLDALALDTDSAEAHYYMGFVSERFSKFDEAFGCYQRASACDPTNPQYVVAAGEMLVKMGQLDRAADFLTREGEHFGYNSAIRQSQGHVEMLRNRPQAAADVIGEARLLAPDDLRVLEDLVNAQVAAGRYNDADANLDALLKSQGYKDRRDLRVLKARMLITLGRLPEARNLLVNLTNDEEGLRDSASWSQLAIVSVKLNDLTRLRQASARLVSLNPDSPEGHMYRAQYFRMNHEPDRALTCVDRAIELNPADANALVFKAMVQAESGSKADASATVAQALRIDPANAGAKQLQSLIERGAVGTARAGAENP